MTEFPANSDKARRGSEIPQDPTREKRVEQVTSASAERRKPRMGRKFKETFVGGSARGAVEYMVVEVVVPAIQDTLIDAFQGGIERLIRGEGARVRRGSTPTYSSLGRVNYQSMSSSKPPTSRAMSQQSRARHDFGEILIQNRAEAEEVLERLYDELSRYNEVTVAVLYELTGIQSSHVDHRWGWKSLRGAKVLGRPRLGGYLLDLPEPEPLDR